MQSPPVVGVTTYDVKARWGVWDTQATVLARSYVAALTSAGAVPLAIPVGADAISVINRIDGLVLVGGPDLDPARYSKDPHQDAQTPDPVRDAAEIALVAAAERTSLPVLGICRGLEVLNVARGGTLTQHLPELVGHDEHSPGPGEYGSITVVFEPGSHLAGAFDEPSVVVDCYHHQAIERLGAGLVVAGLAEDGTIEAIEDPSVPFFVGVQWHPEVGSDPSIFRAFVASTRALALPDSI